MLLTRAQKINWIWKYWTLKCSHIILETQCLPGGKRVRRREPICTSASCKRAAEADRSLLWNPRAKIQICQSSFMSEEKNKTESYLFGAAKTWLNFCIGRGRWRWHLFVRNGIVCIFVVRPPAIHLVWWNWNVRSIGKRGSLFWPAYRKEYCTNQFYLMSERKEFSWIISFWVSEWWSPFNIFLIVSVSRVMFQAFVLFLFSFFHLYILFFCIIFLYLCN